MKFYKSIEYCNRLALKQLVLCVCPRWNTEGFQIAKWNGEEFEFTGQTNDLFHDCVIAFMPLNEDGEPIND